MKQLDEMKWECFLLEDLFGEDGIEHCKCSNVSKLKKGTFPYVGATTNNNGIIHYIEAYTDLRTKGNCIAFICDGDGSIGLSVYKEHDFIGSTTVKVGRAKWLNRYTGMFFTSVADLGRSRYSFGYKRNDKNLKREHIMLPVSAPHTPDYAYMEEYMRHKEKEMLTKYKKYIDMHLSEIKDDDLNLDSRRWKEFFLTDIFALNSTCSSIDKCKLNGQKGDYPYITRSETNNGWDSLIGKQDNYTLDNGNVISLGLDTQTVFYQHIPFYTGQNIQILSSDYINKYVALFIKPLLAIQMRKFNWGGNGATLGRLKKLKIMLPVTSSSTPDYAFMSQYMQNVEVKQLKAYIDKRLSNMN